jgi:hypothetical protein
MAVNQISNYLVVIISRKSLYVDKTTLDLKKSTFFTKMRTTVFFKIQNLDGADIMLNMEL